MKRMKLRTIGILLVLAMLAMALMSGCDDLGIRVAPDEPMKQAAQANHEIAQQVAANGLPPGSRAGESLTKTTLSSLLYTGLPDHPVDVAPLFPPGEKDAWTTLEAQRTALRTRQELLVRGLGSQLDRLSRLAQQVQTAAESGQPMEAARVLDRLGDVGESVQAALLQATAVSVPEDPLVSAADAALRDETASSVLRIAQAADATAAIRPDALDVAGRVVDRADSLADQWGPLLAAMGIPGVGWAVSVLKQVKTAKDAGNTQRSAEQLVQQIRAFSESPIGQANVTVAGQKTTVADQLLTILRGQDLETRSVVSAALNKTGKDGSGLLTREEAMTLFTQLQAGQGSNTEAAEEVFAQAAQEPTPA